MFAIVLINAYFTFGMINTYYLMIEGQKTGPYTHHELMEMDIAADVLVLSPLHPDWHNASNLPELTTYFADKGIYFPTKRNLANFWWRLLAWGIDYAFLFFVAVAIAAFVGVLIGLLRTRRSTNDGESLSSWINLASFVVFIVYNAVLEAVPLQGSIGKLVCKLAVVDANGMRIKFSTALARNLAKILSSLICGMGFLNIFWSAERQGWHDQLAKTYVVKKG